MVTLHSDNDDDDDDDDDEGDYDDENENENDENDDEKKLAKTHLINRNCFITPSGSRFRTQKHRVWLRRVREPSRKGGRLGEGTGTRRRLLRHQHAIFPCPTRSGCDCVVVSLE